MVAPKYWLRHWVVCMQQAKEMLEAAGFQKNGQVVVLGGATIAGFFASACSLPFDFVKTRIQKMEPLPDGTFPYKGPVDCAIKTFTKEGPLKFYTGFPTYCIRCAQLRSLTQPRTLDISLAQKRRLALHRCCHQPVIVIASQLQISTYQAEVRQRVICFWFLCLCIMLAVLDWTVSAVSIVLLQLHGR